jgi:hypothetical protein
MKSPVKQAVVFPTDRESAVLRKENAVMRMALKRIAEKDIWPDKTMHLYELQSSIHIAEEAIEEIEGD